MSLVALANRSVRRYSKANAQEAFQFSTTTPTETTNTSGWLERIMVYIPSEVISAYVPLAALAEGNSPRHSVAGMWALFLAFAVISPLAAWIIDYTKYLALVKSSAISGRYQFPFFEFVAALVAFAAWAAAVPASVFATTSWFQTWMGTAAVIAVTFALNLIGPLLEKQPK